jgi:outer membrane protein TolC
MRRRLLAFSIVSLFRLAARPAAGAAAPEAPAPSAPAVAPEPEASRITFDEAIRRALARNPTVAMALAEIRRADALVQEARAGWYPSLIGNGSYTRLDHDRPRNGPVVLEENQLYGGLTLTVPLVAPQGWTAERHAADSRRIAEASAVDVRRLVAQATGYSFIAVIAQRLQIRSNDTAIANARAHTPSTRIRVF